VALFVFVIFIYLECLSAIAEAAHASGFILQSRPEAFTYPVRLSTNLFVAALLSGFMSKCTSICASGMCSVISKARAIDSEAS
jgi:hypothetical protein